MYKLRNLLLGGQDIIRIIDNACIPMNEANTDYANFKKEVLAGAELQDAEGNVMTDAAEYVRTLPWQNLI